MELKKILSLVADCDGAELTNRCIPGDDNFANPEWSERSILDGVPVVIYYRTTPEDQVQVEAVGGDWGVVDWPERLDRIEIDQHECDRTEIEDVKIEAVKIKFELIPA